MRLLTLLLLCASFGRAALTPRLLYSDQMGSTHFAHTTFVKGQPQWFSMHPVWAVPIACDHTALTCATDGSYTPTGAETSVNVLSEGGTMPAYQYGSFTSSTGGGVTTLTLTSGTPFTPQMVGQEIRTGSSLHTDYWETTNVHTVVSYIDSTHITADHFTEGDQTNAPYWYGGLWGQVGCCYTVPYDVCDVSGNTFTLRQHIAGQSCSTEPVQPFVTDGGNLYLVLNSAACYIQPAVTGLPADSTVTWYNYGGMINTTPGAPGYELSSCGATPYDWLPAITVPAGAADGTYNITFTFSQNPDGSGAAGTRTFPITVISQPSVRGAPSSYPSLPNRSSWETLNRQYLDYYCVPSGGSCTTDDSSCLQHQGYHGKVNVSGTSVTWASGDQFNNGMPWAKFYVNGVSYYPVTYVNPTHITLPSAAGSLTGVSYSSGSSWDATVGFTLGAGAEPGALYYPDGILTYLFAASHYAQSKYQVCALTIADLYSKAVNNGLVNGGTGMQFQEVFGWGLWKAWQLTGKAAYANAINNMATYPLNHYPYQKAQLGWGGMPGHRAGGFRENLLGLDLETAWSQLNDQPYSYPDDPERGRPDNTVANDRYANLVAGAASAIQGYADYPCDGCSVANQPFYFIYLAHALRHIDEISPNDYVLYIAQRGADWLKQWYDMSNHTGNIYNTAFNFVGCWSGMSSDPASYRFGPGKLWFYMDADGNCGYTTGAAAYSGNSLNMAAALWSYVWKNTGIDTYRQYAYDAFAHSTDGVQCCNPAGDMLDPKQTNQIFGFDGLSQVLLDALPPAATTSIGGTWQGSVQ